MEYYLIGINLLTFIIYGIDKWFAKKNMWRIKEATLFFLAFIGGGTGAILGMLLFHHKTKHIIFYVWNVLMIVIWIILIMWVW